MIQLTTTSDPEVTIISNLFIDQYMPAAGGEFVKVYIYLIRLLGSASTAFSLEEMADHLLCSEKDILRALKYWTKVGLLSVEYDSQKQIRSIALLPPVSSDTKDPATSMPQGKAAGSTTGSTPQAAYPAATYQEPTSASHSYSRPKAPDPAYADPARPSEPAAPATSDRIPTRPLSPARVRELKQNEDIVQLLYIAEQYLGKTLTATEMQKILYFYDELKMSAALIEYLIEYCVSKNHRSIRYIESVALNWVKDGIRTVDEARSASSLYQKDYFTILKALGITGRNPVDNEIAYMDTWLGTYGFSMDLIREACSRTILQTGQASFQYTDKILKGWKENKVHSLSDVEALDEQYKQKKAARSAARKTPDRQPQAQPQNRFNNFQQREYDFAEYEKLLLNQ